MHYGTLFAVVDALAGSGDPPFREALGLMVDGTSPLE